jgi:hypothetical protein
LVQKSIKHKINKQPNPTENVTKKRRFDKHLKTTTPQKTKNQNDIKKERKKERS